MPPCTPCQKAKRALRGSIGLAKAALHLDRTDQAQYEQRIDICRSCEYAKPCPDDPNDPCQCLECSCWIKVKARLATESCPMGMW